MNILSSKHLRFLVVAVSLSLSAACVAALRSSPSPSPTFSPVLPAAPASPSSDPGDRQTIDKWCSDVQLALERLKWGIQACPKGVEWKIGGSSVQGRPLVYAEFGDPAAANTTLILTMVHGDEITPLYIGILLLRWLQANVQDSPKTRVVIAPLVNPDGFFNTPRTRMNARGVDVNRNFATRDWGAAALKAWKTRFHSDPRRYPGPEARSEPETIFQESLIQRFKPQKILSVHAPLNFLDYDGPNQLTLSRFPSEYVQECLKLRKQLKAISSGFFPGSLGNFAGQELGIPTLTLELPTADPRKAFSYWKKFKEGIRKMVEFSMPSYAVRGSGRNS